MDPGLRRDDGEKSGMVPVFGDGARFFFAEAVIPAKAGIHRAAIAMGEAWIPAFAGMTGRNRGWSPFLETEHGSSSLKSSFRRRPESIVPRSRWARPGSRP